VSARAPVLIPAAFSFPGDAARQDGWGRLLELSPARALLATGMRVSRGETLLLDFELGGETFRATASRVEHVEPDADGHAVAELRWTDELERRRLSVLILDVLSKR
jgi:hypothetical protein